MASSNQNLQSTDAPIKGMVLAIAGMFLLPVMDAVAKYLGEAGNLSPGFIALARFGIQLILSSAFLLLFGGGLAALRPKRFWMNFFRGMLIALASLLFFVAIKYMPLADAIAVFFVEALILTVLSMLILREKVGWRRIAAVVSGFIGALIVVQPSFAVLGPVSLLPLATALLFATYLLLNRVAGHSDNAWVMQFIAGLGGVFVLGVVIAIGELININDMQFTVPDNFTDWGLLTFMGAIGVTGHFMVVRAFQMAPASLLAPFQYVEIVAAVLLGLILFDDFPTPSKWVGIFIIVLSGLYVFWREQRKN